ncbi:MAG: sulfatase [Chthoniobacteraceae bacterium]
MRFLLALLCLAVATRAGDSKPNILWLIAEDMGPTALACYGQKAVATPVIDQLARDGVRFTRAYTTCPVCSPSRSAFMTGMYQTTIGAHHHRAHRDDGYRLPDGVRLLTEWMRDAGYFTANLMQLPPEFGFKGAGKTDWNFTPPASSFDSKKWSELAARQPFFAQINFQETHRAYRGPKRADPARIELPPYYPDHPVAREDYAAYLDSAAELDRKVGLVLARLEKEGLAENTIVFFFGDNGESMVRGKQFCYEEGLHVPLIVRWPAKLAEPAHFKAGTVDDRLIEAIDFAPTLLDLAGANVPSKMQGRVMFGERVAPPREYAFGARDRCDETVFRLRTVRDRRFRYMRNFTPERPFLQPNGYKEKQYPVWTLLPKLHAEGKLTPAQAALCAPTMPPEELYDLETDPHEIHNLAAEPAHAETLARLRGVLEKWIEDTNDQGRVLEPEELVKTKGATKPGTPPLKDYALDPVKP